MITQLVKTQLVKQRYVGDCSVACLAMMTGLKYEYVAVMHSEELDREFEGGVFENVTADVYKKITGKELFLFSKSDFRYNQKALLTVRSKNCKGVLHCLYWDGTKLYDPSNYKRYRKIPKKILSVWQEVEQGDDHEKI